MQEINFIVYLVQYSTAHEQIQTIILIDTTRALLRWACSWRL